MKEKFPQILQANFTDDILIAKFKCKFRKRDPAKTPMNLPTACLLSGKEVANPNQRISIDEDEIIFIYWDEGNLLRKDRYSSVVRFWKTRHHWEDYDFCVFPISLDWCAGFTHNGKCVLQLAEKE